MMMPLTSTEAEALAATKRLWNELLAYNPRLRVQLSSALAGDSHSFDIWFPIGHPARPGFMRTLPNFKAALAAAMHFENDPVTYIHVCHPNALRTAVRAIRERETQRQARPARKPTINISLEDLGL